ncbi:MAG: TonB-dependent receptor [Acidobacteria bacterium]|nr:TonB-dependent receptor [Acidobacteriota bacterium]
MRRERIFVCVALLYALSSGLMAQTITAGIEGTVTDQSGAILPGVTVTARNLETGLTRAVVSDDRGFYRAPSLPLGPYEIKAELPGFQTVFRRGVTLTLGQAAVVNMAMSVGGVTEEVEVIAEAPLVETTRATVGELVDDKKIRDLPLNGRDFSELALLQAGVVNSISAPRSQIGNEGTKMSIAGTRSTQTAVLLDGTDIRSELNTTPGGPAGALLGVETVREFQVITGVFSAEYGRFTGGVINAVSKSGTNELHGSLFEFHRNSALDARNFFDQGDNPPPFKRNQFGFTLGGPIVRDRTFAFGSYEGLRQRLSLTQVASVPTLLTRQGFIPRTRFSSDLINVGVAPVVRPYLELYPLPNGKDNGDGSAEFRFEGSNPINEHYAMVKVDHQISQTDSFFVRYTFDQGDKLVTPRLPLFGEEGVFRNQWVTLEEKKIISPALINELRFGFSRSKHHVLPVDFANTDPALRFIPAAPRVFGEVIVPELTTLGPSHNQFKTNVVNNYQITENVIYTRGRHALKFGVDFQRQQYNFLNFARASGLYEFSSLENFLRGQPVQFDGFVNDFSTVGTRQNLIGLYVQDDLSAHAALKLNLGLRYEFITVPKEVAGRLGNMETPMDPVVRLGNPYFTRNPSLKNFSPRVGLAWDVFGDGKTSLRAGFGIFFDQILSNYYSAPLQQSPPNIRAVVRNPGNFPRDFFFLGDVSQIKQGPWVIFNPVQPYVIQYSLNIQRELLPSTVFLIGYAGSRGLHLGRFVDTNVAIGQRINGRWFFPPDSASRNRNFGIIQGTVWDTNSFYNSLRLSLNKRFSQGVQFQVSYNFSKLIDEGASTSFFDRGSGGDAGQALHYDDVHLDRGPSGFHIGHTFVTNYTVDLPGSNLAGVVGLLLGGWQTNGIITAASGEQMTITMTFDQARQRSGFRVQRPDLVSGRNPVIGSLPDGYLDPGAFAVPPAGFFGNLGRGTLEGPGRFTYDFSLIKNFRVREKATVQFRSEFFNLFNNVNFAVPGTRPFVNPQGRVSGSFGKSTRTVTTSRQIQFGLKVVF